MLKRLQSDLREDPPPGLVLEPDESLELRQLDPREFIEAAPKAFGGEKTNEEVVRLRREERGMPRAWFGPEAVEEAGLKGQLKPLNVAEMGLFKLLSRSSNTVFQ